MEKNIERSDQFLPENLGRFIKRTIYLNIKTDIFDRMSYSDMSNMSNNVRQKQANHFIINNVSFLLYLKIIYKTIICIFKKAGAR